MASPYNTEASSSPALGKASSKNNEGSAPLPRAAGTSPQYPSCPECGSTKTWKDGIRETRLGPVQRYVCRSCGYRFSFNGLGTSEALQRIYTKPLKSKVNITINCRGQDETLKATSFSRTGLKKTSDAATVVRLEASAKEKPAGGTEKQTAGEIKPETIKGKIVEFLWKLEKDGRTKGTIKNYSRMLNSFLKNNINPFDPEEVKDYIAKTPFELSTKDNFCRMLNVWFRFLGINWQQPKYTYSAKIPFIPTEQELDQLIAGCGRKTATFLQLLKETGARAGEIGKLTWNDIDFERRIVRISAEKGSLPRMLPISLKVINMLENIKKNVNSNRIFIRDSIYVNFSIARKRIAQKLANPRILNITFHTFRHWKATMEYHKTKDILHVKELLGHRNLESTQIYIHIERTLFTNAPPEEFHVKVAKTQEEITQLLEAGFEYVLQKDGLAFFRKRK